MGWPRSAIWILPAGSNGNMGMVAEVEWALVNPQFRGT